MSTPSAAWLDEAEELVRTAEMESPCGIGGGVALFRTPKRRYDTNADEREAADKDYNSESPVLLKAEALSRQRADSQCISPPTASTVVQLTRSQLVRADEDDLSHRLLERLRRISHATRDRTLQSAPLRAQVNSVKCGVQPASPSIAMGGRMIMQSLRQKRSTDAKMPCAQLPLWWTMHIHRQLIAKVLRGWREYVYNKKEMRKEDQVLRDASSVMAAATQREVSRCAEKLQKESEQDAAEEQAASAFRACSLARLVLSAFLSHILGAREIEAHAIDLKVNRENAYVWKWWVHALGAFRIAEEARARVQQRKHKLDALFKGVSTIRRTYTAPSRPAAHATFQAHAPFKPPANSTYILVSGETASVLSETATSATSTRQCDGIGVLGAKMLYTSKLSGAQANAHVEARAPYVSVHHCCGELNQHMHRFSLHPHLPQELPSHSQQHADENANCKGRGGDRVVQLTLQDICSHVLAGEATCTCAAGAVIDPLMNDLVHDPPMNHTRILQAVQCTPAIANTRATPAKKVCRTPGGLLEGGGARVGGSVTEGGVRATEPYEHKTVRAMKERDTIRRARRMALQVWESCHAHVNESRHTHVSKSRHTHVNESRHTHVHESRHTHMNESRHKFD